MISSQLFDMFQSTVHSTKHYAEEIANTMNLLCLAIHNILLYGFSHELKNRHWKKSTEKRVSIPVSFMLRIKHHAIRVRTKKNNQKKSVQEYSMYFIEKKSDLSVKHYRTLSQMHVFSIVSMKTKM